MDAWIESLKFVDDNGKLAVASYVDAWIERLKRRYTSQVLPQSHPMWMRGLKADVPPQLQLAAQVASYVDAWIESPGSR